MTAAESVNKTVANPMVAKIGGEILLPRVPVWRGPAHVRAVPAHALGDLLRQRRTRPIYMPLALHDHGAVP